MNEWMNLLSLCVCVCQVGDLHVSRHQDHPAAAAEAYTGYSTFLQRAGAQRALSTHRAHRFWAPWRAVSNHAPQNAGVELENNFYWRLHFIYCYFLRYFQRETAQKLHILYNTTSYAAKWSQHFETQKILVNELVIICIRFQDLILIDIWPMCELSVLEHSTWNKLRSLARSYVIIMLICLKRGKRN